MTAIIYDHKTESTYVSPIFSIRADRSEVVAFNSDRSGVKRISIGCVYIVSGDISDHKNGKWRGYEWVIDNKRLFRSLKYYKTASLEKFPEFKKYTDEIVLPEWFEITDEASISSFMNTSRIFHDAKLKSVERDGDVIAVRIRSNFGCYFNMKFIGAEEICNIEKDLEIYNSEITFKDGYYTFLMDDFDDRDSYIKCKKILWNIEVITKFYLREHRNYPDISALYRDISCALDNAELADGKLIINSNTRIEAELKNGEYVITLDGKREKGSVEDQDIYYSLLEYVYDDLEQCLWKFEHKRIFSLPRAMINALIPGCYAIPLFIISVISESKADSTIGGIFFGLFSLITYIVFTVSYRRITYKITDSSVSIGDSGGCPYSVIKDVILKPSRIFKNRGTVKIKTTWGNYYLRFVTGADEAYEIIRERINKA